MCTLSLSACLLIHLSCCVSICVSMYTCVCLSLSVCVFIKTIAQSACKYTITTILHASPNRRNPSEFFDMPGLADNLPVWTMADLVAKGNPKYEDNKKKSYYTAINSKVSFSAFPKLLGVRSLTQAFTQTHARAHRLTYILPHMFTYITGGSMAWTARTGFSQLGFVYREILWQATGVRIR